jgi:hypothetical protein
MQQEDLVIIPTQNSRQLLGIQNGYPILLPVWPGCGGPKNGMLMNSSLTNFPVWLENLILGAYVNLSTEIK